MTDTPIFSVADVEAFTPPGSERTYHLAPLTLRERNAASADVVEEAGIYPSQDRLFTTMRDALTEAAPDNLQELLVTLDAAQAAPEDAELQARVLSIETVCMSVPAYRALLAQRVRWMGALPMVMLRHALRDWSGPGLPPFKRVRGVVPFELLDVVPPEELNAASARALVLGQLRSAAGNGSAAPSPSSGIRKGSKARSSRRAAAATSSRARKSRPTLA